ncbi:MAG: 5-dehydro-4-deoxy-D-glucuronate isomerase [Phycisphaerae bacterium]|nr:5-dehydro-4-deoxy-D-glucuronate isomerase [Phycisphaerae bacterium]
MEVRYSADPVRFARMTTDEVRKDFLIDTLFVQDEITMVYSDIDRAIVGSAVPQAKPLILASADELRAEYFCQRRELGVLNIGGSGTVDVDGTSFEMADGDGMYIGMGSKSIKFASNEASSPAKFYLLSYPAHQSYPTAQAKKADAAAVTLGSVEASNKRTIYKYIHPDGIKSCQLVMGFTELQPGCVWNTMPAHTHERRMEVYLYFGMDADTRLFHLMGQPQETRHIVVANQQAVISPSWSIHSGVGTGAYTFCWGMGGENQAFDDMDHVGIGDLK